MDPKPSNATDLVAAPSAVSSMAYPSLPPPLPTPLPPQPPTIMATPMFGYEVPQDEAGMWEKMLTRTMLEIELLGVSQKSSCTICV
jgi:hypothetical protein